MGRAGTELERGRERHAAQAWREAYDLLARADRAHPLAAEDLERLATAAYLLGDEDDYLRLLERAHGRHADGGDARRAVRCAFWIGVHFAQRGDTARAGGWLARAQRLLEQHGPDELERGYLLLPAVFAHEARGDLAGAGRIAGEAVAIAERHGDRDLFALAAHMQGHVLVEDARLAEGLALLDEVIVPAAAGELSPIVTGIVYCGVILACQDARDVRRAREWTAVLSRWCDRQPDLVAFTGRCRVHRAELMQLGGSWPEALAEVRRAAQRCRRARNEAAAGEAAYVEGEIHRLRGEHAAAERAFRDASRRGRDPHPGLALLRLAQDEQAAALGLIRRALAETGPPTRRVALLPACVEIALASGRLDEARSAWSELDALTGRDASPALAATVAQAEGAVALAAGEPGVALPLVRRAAATWRELQAPYEVARARELAGLACQALGDGEGAALEREAALRTYEQLGATPDVVRLGGGSAHLHGLTARELEVLRMVAAGDTNRAIASQLVLSVRTVDRHVSNIYAKLGVSSRAAATAYAHAHRLV